MKKSAVCLLALLGPWVASYAIEPIPAESGVRGYVNLGATALRLRNNTVAGLAFLDIGEERIGSLTGSPDGRSLLLPSLNAEVSCTWAPTRSQVFLGNRLEDFIRFDSTSALGLRQEAGNIGILEGGFLFSGLPTEVWEDPYLEGEDRTATRRRSTGAQFGWDKILGSPMEVILGTRRIDIGDERSGVGLELPPAERALLARDGNLHQAEILCLFRPAERHTLVPAVRAARFDLDGAAMRNDRFGLKLTHTYMWDRARLITNLSFGRAEYDHRHPVFGTTRRDDLWGLTVSGFWPHLLGHAGWTGVASVLYALQDSNIPFYESDVTGASLSVLYSF